MRGPETKTMLRLEIITKRCLNIVCLRLVANDIRANELLPRKRASVFILQTVDLYAAVKKKTQAQQTQTSPDEWGIRNRLVARWRHCIIWYELSGLVGSVCDRDRFSSSSRGFVKLIIDIISITKLATKAAHAVHHGIDSLLSDSNGIGSTAVADRAEYATRQLAPVSIFLVTPDDF